MTTKDLKYCKENAEEDYRQVPISVLRYITELEGEVKKIKQEYDALCPKPSEFPDGYEWFSIDADGQPAFRATKPEISCDCWIEVTSRVFCQKDIIIPLGLDWRLCRWSIEDAKRIHGEEQ